ncbi:hypothetical protein SAMN05421780_110119 [Flexibacter flexilis DSM 6793]|uniref:Uncharacterized protein n=1 Tax=Flexibacter flexilis DSM 6793 TaxID=927664 RepID=A0A1I1MMS3_9BACT|nr:hypothetical protein [Flexibacter flexilis]SFC82850.1 hypothetical protein SAMN05421780_110119 [Flexibacter flexilis DSM 6793]
MKKIILYLLVSACLPAYAQKKKTKAAKPVTVLDYFIRKDKTHSEYMTEGNVAYYIIEANAAKRTFTEKVQWSDCCEGGEYENGNNHFRYDKAANKLILFQEDIGIKVLRVPKMKSRKKKTASTSPTTQEQTPSPIVAIHGSELIRKYVYTDKNVALLLPPPDQKITIQTYQQQYDMVFRQWLNGKVKDVDTSGGAVQEDGYYFINKNTNSLEYLCMDGQISEAECERRKQELAEKNKQDSISIQYFIRKIPIRRTFSLQQIYIDSLDNRVLRDCILVEDQSDTEVVKKYYAYQLGLVRITHMNPQYESEDSESFSMSFTQEVKIDEE